MPFAELDGQPLFYFEHRRGTAGSPPLVLVHGAGGTHLHWPPEVRRLEGVDVFAPDLPGHGQSAGPGGAQVESKAQSVLALLDHLGLERVVIGGHSMGGAVAQTLVLAHPERVFGLVLVGTGARLKVSPEILHKVEHDFPGSVDLVIEWMFGPAVSEQLRRLVRERMLEMDPTALLADWRACDSFDVRERLGELAGPALVLCGDADRLTPEKYSRYLAEKIPGAELHLLPGAGHMVMLEQPREVARLIASFLRRLAGG